MGFGRAIAFRVLIRIARKCFGDGECRCWYSGGQTLIALRIARKFRSRRLALHAFEMRRGTAVRNRADKARRRLFRPGRDRVEFERCCLTRRRGGAEKHAENIFSGLASELAGLCRKVKTWERGDSGDRTASQRGSRWGGRLTNAARGGYRNWSGAFRCWQGGGKTGTQYKISANFPLRPA